MGSYPWRDRDVLKEWYMERDCSMAEVADEFDTSTATIHKWVEKHGLQKEQNTPWRDESVMKTLYEEQDLSVTEIAEKLDSAPPTISKWIRKHGFKVPYSWREHLSDSDWLYEKYWGEMMSTTEIAEELDCSQSAVSNWLNRHDIETRKSNDEKPPRFTTNNFGYEIIQTHVVGEQTYHVPVHRLIMVAEHGFDSLDGMEVHHQNEIKWDNRPENLELMDPTEHRRHHMTE